ncbi:MAG: histone deacetylase [Elusimicrobia bacterium]|nr:MAG: histone deacetylase [Elusimicrobiota bacterium]
MKVYYSPDYVVDIGNHVFPTVKFAHTAERLISDGVINPVDLADPGAIERDALLVVHDNAWVKKIFDGTMTLQDETSLEMRWSPSLAMAHRKCAAGTVKAAREALETGLGLHIGGGSHHAFAGHGEGFCVFNDLALALETLRREGAIERGAVVDLDVHQGNGTAALLVGREDFSTFSMHDPALYPFDGTGTTAASTVDITMPAGTGDTEYHKLLRERLPAFLDDAGPSLVLYQAGVDVHEDDRLGRFELSAHGVLERDRFVAETVLKRGIALVVTLGGGYGSDPAETGALHAQTIAAAIQAKR